MEIMESSRTDSAMILRSLILAEHPSLFHRREIMKDKKKLKNDHLLNDVRYESEARAGSVW